MGYDFGGLIFGGAYARREIFVSKFDWASLKWEKNLQFWLCFTLYSRANSKYKSFGGAYIRKGDLAEAFLGYDFGGLIFGGAYFRNITVIQFVFNFQMLR